MAERKVLNKYFPPDYDPANVPPRERPKDNQIKVRVMLPFTCQCNTCGEYIYRGKKFNSRCEWADEKYLGITIMRFYIKCPVCSQEVTFKTDPKNSDYIMEHGAVRNVEPWREDDFRLKMMRERNAGFDKDDVMKQLEDRTIESKRELDIIDAIEEIQELNNKNAVKDSEEVLTTIRKSAAQKEQEEEQVELSKVTFGVLDKSKVEKRLESDEDDEGEGGTTSLFGAAIETETVTGTFSTAAKEADNNQDGNSEAGDSGTTGLGLIPVVRVLSKKKKKKKKKHTKEKGEREEGSEPSQKKAKHGT